MYPIRHASLVLSLCALLGGCQPSGPAPTPIGQVQGSGPRSPLEGQNVIVEGVVGADFRTGLGGFYLQSLADDGDPATSEGLFVAYGADAEPGLAPGDRLRVEARVAEFGDGRASLTTLVDARVQRLGGGEAPAPLPIAAAPDTAADWERLEGMRVRIEAPLTVVGHYQLARYGELEASFGGPLWQPTERFAPGPEAERLAADNARQRLLLDDGQTGEDLPIAGVYGGAPRSAAPLRAGSMIGGAVGVVDQRFGRYRLQLDTPLAGVAQAARPAPPIVPGALRLAAFNLENLFNGDGRGGGFPTARGAAAPTLYERQQGKLVTALQALAPDVAALMEVENDGDGADSALAQLVDALNAAGPATDWRFIHSGAGAGGDQIRVALIYRASRVDPVGAVASLSTGPFAHGSRPPLAAAFRQGEAAPIVVVANHFKSKGSCPEPGHAGYAGNRDHGDGQGCWNAARVEAAQALDAWLKTDPTGAGSDRIAIVGDFNAHGEEDPLRTLRALGWVDAFAGQTGAYSYVYNGLRGRLDHALLSPALAPALRGAAEWHVNADELPGFGYARCDGGDCDGPWAASDHDPLLLGLDP